MRGSWQCQRLRSRLAFDQRHTGDVSWVAKTVLVEHWRGERLAQVGHLSQDVPTGNNQSQPLQRHHGSDNV
jgi:hypothetical protein